MHWGSGESLTLTTVGIDIGSATTGVVFSTLRVVRRHGGFSSRFIVTDRQTQFRSPLELTPFLPGSGIDGAALSRIVEAAYGLAGFKPADIDSGSVILTGEAARRDNADTIGTALSAWAGGFVSAAIGDEREGWFAAHGNGSVDLAAAHGMRVLSIDIGGATTKLTVVSPTDGVVCSFAVRVGGRLAAFESGRLIRVDPDGSILARTAGYEWNLQDEVAPEEVDAVGRLGAGVIASFLPNRPVDDRRVEFGLGTPSEYPDRIDHLVISGGVARFVGPDPLPWSGDIGSAVGRALWNELERTGWAERTTIADQFATVLGAAEHSMQVSGSTVYRSGLPADLPLRNLGVVSIPAAAVAEQGEALRSAVTAHRYRFESNRDAGGSIVILPWSGPPSFRRLDAFAAQLVAGLEEVLGSGEPACFAIDADLAATLGRLVAQRMPGRPVVAVDGLDLDDADILDIGPRDAETGTIPVIIKNMLFA